MEKEEFEILLNADKETEHLEFKEAKNSFNFDSGTHSLCGYCIALANEGGGKLFLGVSDKLPREVVGTNAFLSIKNVKMSLFNKIHRRIELEEFFYNSKRILVFKIPSRPIGEPLEFGGNYLMRLGDSLVPMTPDQFKKITKESEHDYSSKTINQASFGDLSGEAITELRKLLNNSGRVDKKDIGQFNDQQLLTDLGLVKDGKITIAALVLLGKGNSLKKFLPYAEIRFGYKTNGSEIRNQDMQIYSEGYILFYNKLWEKINSRNIVLPIPFGLRILEKKAFDEETIREAVNNSLIHRDYSEQDVIMINQTQSKITVTSPGGLLEGITIENMIDQTKTRNKLIADVLFKCDFVEQFGHGVDLMIKNQLSLGKNPPDYSRTDKHHVILKIDGTIQDIEFAKYVLLVASRKKKVLNDKELIILHKIKNNQKIDSGQITENLLNLNLIERIKPGKYILSKEYYQDIGKKGEYTRRKGLDKETNKHLITKHLQNYQKGYMGDFIDVLKNISKPTINKYLNELKEEGKIELIGNPRIVRGPKKAFWKLKKRWSLFK